MQTPLRAHTRDTVQQADMQTPLRAATHTVQQADRQTTLRAETHTKTDTQSTAGRHITGLRALGQSHHDRHTVLGAESWPDSLYNMASAAGGQTHGTGLGVGK